MGVISRYMRQTPALDGLRLKLLTQGCVLGMNYLDSGYDILRLYSPKAQEFLLSETPQPAIFAVYHGHMAGLLTIEPRPKLTILISQSRDGEIAANSTSAVGFSVARGSSGRGGIHGTKAVLSAIAGGQNIAFMVDGPRGPIHKVKTGIIRLAEISKVPIIPLIAYGKYHWKLRSWDKFMVTCWGTPFACFFGDPIYVPDKLTNEDRGKYQQELNQVMNELSGKAEKIWS